MKENRFDRAVRKLYEAFHEGTLNAMECRHCAVGNIVGRSGWKQAVINPISKGKKPDFSIIFDSEDLIKKIHDTGYTFLELANIERLFMYGVKLNSSNIKWFGGDVRHNKENQFKGLCAVIEYLCELEGIENIMDYTSLFEYNENGAINQLS